MLADFHQTTRLYIPRRQNSSSLPLWDDQI
jgi:hypothetical protein